MFWKLVKNHVGNIGEKAGHFKSVACVKFKLCEINISASFLKVFRVLGVVENC